MGVFEGRMLSVGYGAIAGLFYGLVAWLHPYYPIYILLWPAIVYTIVTFAYIINIPSVLALKDEETGRLNHAMIIFMFPFLLLVWLVWYSRAATTSDPSSQHIVEKWYIGRQPLRHADLPHNTAMVVDLSSEFGRLYSLRKSSIKYRCISSLDTSPPPDHKLGRYIKIMKEAIAVDGNVFIHCANGHGRSAAFLVAVMWMSGYSPSLSEAEKTLKSIRPSIRIRAGQRRFLEQIVLDEDKRPPTGYSADDLEKEKHQHFQVKHRSPHSETATR
eukprot:TRINITY_DN2337_c0_g2_i1.p1 TRINITY_DN2337_c0_g2~~TRINITY_DN2337_c0_g2_i1.p1  ORF type:complete len:273 (-),score=47.88 TRINITY_DN2337_c0_g2_i1:553-1371(-)